MVTLGNVNECSWDVSQADKAYADTRITELQNAFDVTLDDQQTRTLRFLFAKQVDKQIEPADFEPSDTHCARTLRALLFSDSKRVKEKRKRLYRITDATTGDTTSTDTPDNVQSWNDFLDSCPEWNNPDTSFVFHRDHELVNRPEQPNCLVQRVQKSGLSYMHGPDVLQHYLVAMGTEKVAESVPMLDLTRYICSHFTPQQLFEHILNNAGGFSVTMLKAILVPESSSDSLMGTPEKYEAKLKGYGPALVSNFQGKKLRYVGKPKGEIVGGHCMVMIGFRLEKGKPRLLLQNWWNKKQFVEVDEAYMLGSEGKVTFVRTPQPFIPSEWEIDLAFYAETEMAMGEDRMPPEMSKHCSAP